MFDIKPYNKMLITKGDAASFTVEVVDLDDKEYEPAETDVLELNVFTDEEVLLTKSADFIDGSGVFSFSNSDTKDIAPSVYDYNIVLYSDGEPYTIIDTTAFEVLGTKPDGEEPHPEPEPEPEPTPIPDPDIDLDPDAPIVVPEEGQYAITFGSPTCYVNDIVTVKMRVAPEVIGVELSLSFDSEYLQLRDLLGGLGNADFHWNSNSISVLDCATEGAAIAEYQFTFDTIKAGESSVWVAEVTDIADENGNVISNGTSGHSSITIKNRPTHSHSYTSSVVAPTCTSQGYTVHTCSICGQSYNDTFTAALGHNYVNGVCSRCGAEEPNGGIEE